MKCFTEWVKYIIISLFMLKKVLLYSIFSEIFDIINMMKKIFFIFFIFSTASLSYSADISDIYYNADSFLDSLSDPNTGLTAFPTLLIPMGGRFEAMGTAFTAVADDASFIEANPAGSASLKYTELSFYHNDWIADTNIESVTFTTRKHNWGIGAARQIPLCPFYRIQYIWRKGVKGLLF